VGHAHATRAAATDTQTEAEASAFLEAAQAELEPAASTVASTATSLVTPATGGQTSLPAAGSTTPAAAGAAGQVVPDNAVSATAAQTLRSAANAAAAPAVLSSNARVSEGAAKAELAGSTQPEQAAVLGATPLEPDTTLSVEDGLAQASVAQTSATTGPMRAAGRVAVTLRAQTAALDEGDRPGGEATLTAFSSSSADARTQTHNPLPAQAAGADSSYAAAGSPLHDASATARASSTLAAALSSGPDPASELGVESLAPTQGEIATTASADASPVLATGVQMQDMIDAIRATVEIASRQGIAQARISLQPEELGHISIRLSQTSEGLLARVSAATPAAAQALAAGRAELHQTLSSLGVSLLRLDIGSFGQSEAESREGRFGTSSDGSSASRGSSSGDEADGIDPSTGAEEVGAPTGAPLGELVDVLA
jgi:flagellar hook-length control protein FliK